MEWNLCEWNGEKFDSANLAWLILFLYPFFLLLSSLLHWADDDNDDDWLNAFQLNGTFNKFINSLSFSICLPAFCLCSLLINLTNFHSHSFVRSLRIHSSIIDWLSIELYGLLFILQCIPPNRTEMNGMHFLAGFGWFHSPPPFWFAFELKLFYLLFFTFIR